MHHSGGDRGQQNVTHRLPDVMEASQSATGFPVHPNIFYGCHTGAPVFPPLSPGWICECSTLPFEERLPPVCTTPPFIVPPWVTSSCAVLSSAVHSASGESNRILPLLYWVPSVYRLRSEHRFPARTRSPRRREITSAAHRPRQTEQGCHLRNARKY